MKCLNCQDKNLVQVLSYNGVEVDTCPSCRGIWLDKGEILFFAKNTSAFKEKLKHSFLTRVQSDRISPYGSEKMVLVQYLNTVPFYFCNQTQGIWIDYDATQYLNQIDPNLEFKIPTISANPKEDANQLVMQLLPLPNLFLHGSFTIVGLFIPVFILICVLFNLNIEEAHNWAYSLVIFSILGSIFSPAILDWELKSLYKMQWKTMDELPSHIKEFLMQFCLRNNIRFPRFGIIDDNAPQAFTYGYHPNSARIVLSKGVLELCNEDEVEAVIAHELGHIMNHDMLVMTIAQLAPTLLYAIYQTFKPRRKSGKRSKSEAQMAIIAVIAYILYVVCNYILLWFSRIRELHADRFSGNLTKNPNALAKALIKIGYGLATIAHKSVDNESTESKESLDKYKQTATMGIYSLNTAKSLALNKNHNELTKKDIESSMNWEIYNPWAKFFEFSSTHPLIAKRLMMLFNQAKALGSDPLLDINLNPRVKLNSWYKLAYELFLEAFHNLSKILVILLVASLFLNYDPSSKFIFIISAIALIITGLLVFYRCSLKYKSQEFNNFSIASLLKVINVSPLHPIPCTIEGEIVGKGSPGFVWTEDHFIQDETAMIYADYTQPLSLMELFSALKHRDKFIGKKVKVTGWYHRGPVPYIHIKEFDCDGEILRSHKHSFEFFVSYVPIAIGIIAIFMSLNL